MDDCKYDLGHPLNPANQQQDGAPDSIPSFDDVIEVENIQPEEPDLSKLKWCHVDADLGSVEREIGAQFSAQALFWKTNAPPFQLCFVQIESGFTYSPSSDPSSMTLRLTGDLVLQFPTASNGLMTKELAQTAGQQALRAYFGYWLTPGFLEAAMGELPYFTTRLPFFQCFSGCRVSVGRGRLGVPTSSTQPGAAAYDGLGVLSDIVLYNVPKDRMPMKGATYELTAGYLVLVCLCRSIARWNGLLSF